MTADMQAIGKKNKGVINGNGCKNNLLETGMDGVPDEKVVRYSGEVKADNSIESGIDFICAKNRTETVLRL
jgi:hypothetical protein